MERFLGSVVVPVAEDQGLIGIPMCLSDYFFLRLNNLEIGREI